MTLHNIQCQIFKIFFFYLTVKLPQVKMCLQMSGKCVNFVARYEIRF